MQLHFFDLLRYAVGVAAGGTIGFAFGLLQQAALGRHELRQRTGQLKNGWSVMPGSGARVAYLLVALALVQLVCPLLFVDGVQWIVSSGVVLGYGAILLRQLKLRVAASRP
jgi:hypothetical protein